MKSNLSAVFAVLILTACSEADSPAAVGNAPFVLPASVGVPSVCPDDRAFLHARYRIAAGGETRMLDLYRRANEVLHVGREPDLAEYWRRLPNDRIVHTRFFDDYGRGIEYEPSDLLSVTGAQNWAALSGLAPVRPDAEASGEGCTALADRHTVFGRIAYLTELDLMAYRRTYGATISLVALDFDRDAIDAAFRERDDYPLVDFADVGDMENDDELARMMAKSFMERRDHGHAH